jgi:glutaredoxin
MRKGLYIAVVVIATLGAIKFGLIEKPFSKNPTVVNTPVNEVVLYATSWCGYCAKTRQLLSDNGIAYTEHDIETSAEGKQGYDQLKGNGVPLLQIGNGIVRGYNPSKILQLAKGS